MLMLPSLETGIQLFFLSNRQARRIGHESTRLAFFPLKWTDCWLKKSNTRILVPYSEDGAQQSDALRTSHSARISSFRRDSSNHHSSLRGYFRDNGTKAHKQRMVSTRRTLMSPMPFSIRAGCFVAQKKQDDVTLPGQEHKGRWNCRGILRRLPSAVRSIPFRRCHFL